MTTSTPSTDQTTTGPAASTAASADQTTATDQTTAVIPRDEVDTTGARPAGGTPGYGTPGYGAPAFPGQPVAAQPASVLPAQPRTNVLGIITLVLGVLGFGLVPVITGQIALNQIKRTGEDGRGLTLAGLILGYVTLAGWLIVAFFWVAVAGLAVIGAAAGSGYGY
ncbi:DUF4190 domain-containing protein [Herbiconiux sp. CPCC 205716]|uniref:DUF4190 domain-containing protein n=1 Tax=Herbiconiux gentiana TaxID=2970912 RepID=A0ABT2GDL0_9MICO|nr:DUF4190 domain-containing protein [Herbiconiux gentiana]MCS5714311.1 DUF4190 domain-containing protein [Herbiconiux gentiana]